MFAFIPLLTFAKFALIHSFQILTTNAANEKALADSRETINKLLAENESLEGKLLATASDRV